MKRFAVAVVALLMTSSAPTHAQMRPTAREGADHAVPLYGELIRTWDAPDDDPFAPGHRGIDIAAPAGSPVRASAGGVVTFSGTVAGNRSVTIEHGAQLRTTYSFLQSASVTRNEHVALGTVVGTVGAGHPGGSQPHVHLSARRDGVYFDPIALYLGDSVVGLLTLVE